MRIAVGLPFFNNFKAFDRLFPACSHVGFQWVSGRNVNPTCVFLSLVLGLSTPSYATTVTASWYGPGFHNKRTASGERFNQYAMTAAHRHLPFGTRVKVTHKGRSVVVRINDRGPFVRGRSLDLSKGAARRLGCLGVCRVGMTIVGRRR